MRKFMLIAIFPLVLLVGGCAVLQNPYFWKLTVSAVLKAAYKSGGAEDVEARIDKLVAKGKISEELGEKLKYAAQAGYDKLLDKLEEEETDSITVEDEDLAD